FRSADIKDHFFGWSNTNAIPQTNIKGAPLHTCHHIFQQVIISFNRYGIIRHLPDSNPKRTTHINMIKIRKRKRTGSYGTAALLAGETTGAECDKSHPANYYQYPF